MGLLHCAEWKYRGSLDWLSLPIVKWKSERTGGCPSRQVDLKEAHGHQGLSDWNS
jgi:hypothetical protein